MLKPDILVGDAPYCDFTTIQAGLEHLNALPRELTKTMDILEGIYEGPIESRLSNFFMRGLGQVIITGAQSAGELTTDGTPRTTFHTATLFIEGENIRLENLTIRNTAGPGEKVQQAVALFNNATKATVENCRLEGYQDTLCTGPLPPLQKDHTPFVSPIKIPQDHCYQVYRYCYISGTVDFIFGGAEAWFEHCQIHSRQSPNPGYIAAASTPKNQDAGFEFYFCYLTSDPGTTQVFLGRPWRSFARTTYRDCFIGPHIDPAGWDNWDDPMNELTATYREIGSKPQDFIRPVWIKKTTR